MNICILTAEFPPDPGGPGEHLYRLSKTLTQRGHRVTVITRGTWRKTYYEEVNQVPVYRVRFIPSYPDVFKLHGIFVNRLFRSLETNFDLVHVHSPLAPLIETSLPVIYTVHGRIRPDIDNMPVKSLRFLIIRLLRNQLLKAEKNILNRANVIVAVSELCAQDVISETKGKKLIVINPGVDTKFFHPLKDKDQDSPYILYSGRLETRKGLADLVASAEYVCRKRNDARFILTSKGTIEGYLKREIRKRGLERNFLFTGHLDRNTLRRYYQNAAVTVLPSYYEAFPAVLIEAMACGCPVIGTDIDGTREIIADGKTGLLVPPRNPGKLAEAISTLLDNEKTRQEMGTNARKRAVEKYEWEAMVDKVEDIYRQAGKSA